MMKNKDISCFVRKTFIMDKVGGKPKYKPHYFKSNNPRNDGKNVDIAYAKYTESSNRKAFVIVPGMSEGFIKYAEMVHDLFLGKNKIEGYDVYLIDNRGHGYSSRLIKNEDAIYVYDFNHYIDDLNKFMTSVVNNEDKNKKVYESVVFFGHSMGGGIVLKYLEDYGKKRKTTNIKYTILSSPMIQANAIIPEYVMDYIILL